MNIVQDFQARKHSNIYSDCYGVGSFVIKTVSVVLSGAFLPMLIFGIIL